MISIVTVTFNSNDFANLLLESLDRFHSETVEVVIVNNGKGRFVISPVPNWYFEKEKGIILNCHENQSPDKTHGSGLNYGLTEVKGEEVLILDVDCHFLAIGWEKSFRNHLEGSHCVTVEGSPEKPMRPACCFMRTTDARQHDWRATPGYRGHRLTPDGFDVGIVAYHEMRAAGRDIRFLDTIKPSRYGTRTGEEYGAYIYHHWHGTHLVERQYDYAYDLLKEKAFLFEQVPWRRRAKLL